MAAAVALAKANTAAVKAGNDRKKAAQADALSKRQVGPGGEEEETTPQKVVATKVERPVHLHYQYPTEGFWKHQEAARIFYQKSSVVVGVAGLIVFNFFVSMAEKTIDPGPVPLKFTNVWDGFGLFFNVCFTIELGVNMYSFQTNKHLDPDFFWTGRSMSWNLFDLVVVMIGLLGYVEMLLPVALPSWLSKLRLMRAFRVFRLFKRVKSLNKILVSLGKAIPGMMNAFLIMLIVMCIYAILGVEFFKYYGTCKGPSAADDTMYVYDDTNFPIGIMSEEELAACSTDSSPEGIVLDSRGVPFGTAYFGNFLKSLYTLFQVLTGDSWSEAVGRPLMTYTPTSVVFFVSFILLNPVILINVVVAVLLEKMVSDEDDEEESGDDDDDDDDATAGVASADDGGAEHHADGGGGDAPHAPTPSKPPSHGSSRQAKDGKGEFEVAARLQGLEEQIKGVSGMLKKILEAEGIAVRPPPRGAH